MKKDNWKFQIFFSTKNTLMVLSAFKIYQINCILKKNQLSSHWNSLLTFFAGPEYRVHVGG